MSATNTTAQTVRGLCTPEQHAQSSNAKPVILLELGTGPHGKFAQLAFPDGWERTIDLPTETEAWHPMFKDLPQEDRIKLHRHARPAIIKHPDGRRTQPGVLTFMTRSLTRQGGYLSENMFDVPAQSYSDGLITGYKCADELLAVTRRGYGPHLNTGRIIEAAIEAGKDSFDKPGRRGAANAFMEVVCQAMSFLAKQGNTDVWIASRMEQAERDNEYWEKLKVEENEAFVKRMKAGKAKKNGGTA